MYMNYFIHSMYLLIDALIMSCRGCNDDDRSAILLNRKIVCSFHNIELLKKNVIMEFISGDQTWKRRIRF